MGWLVLLPLPLHNPSYSYSSNNNLFIPLLTKDPDICFHLCVVERHHWNGEMFPTSSVISYCLILKNTPTRVHFQVEQVKIWWPKRIHSPAANWAVLVTHNRKRRKQLRDSIAIYKFGLARIDDSAETCPGFYRSPMLGGI